ncbi:mechanosensitive ion channel [Chitinophagaceae bacterium 26-R-25]|nr:mechanosensitive ion channel [Chitinophagaceae bacterium 26-R-25]
MAKAQQKDSLSANDTVKKKSHFVKVLEDVAEKEEVLSIQKFKNAQVASRRRKTLDETIKLIRAAKILLKKGIDTVELAHELELAGRDLKIVRDGVFINNDAGQTQRNLTESSAILSELILNLQSRKRIVDKYEAALFKLRSGIDSLATDTTLYQFPSDSAVLMKYMQQLVVVAKEVSPVDSAIDKSLESTQKLQNRINYSIYEIRSTQEDVENFMLQLHGRSLSRELPGIFTPFNTTQSLAQVIALSKHKGFLALNFYLKDNIAKIIVLVVLIILTAVFIYSLRRIVYSRDESPIDFEGKLSLRFPVVSAIFIMVNLGQFMFIGTPFIFSALLWLISLACLSIIFYKFISTFWMVFWLSFAAMFMLASIDNLILQASMQERWGMLLLSMVGAVYGCVVLISDHRKELRERGIRYFIIFMIVFETISFFLNLFGRFNLSKTFFTGGFMGLVIAISFLWTVRLLNEVLGFASSVYKEPGMGSFYINFNKVGNKVPAILYVLLVTGWIILVGRNFYSFKAFADPFNDFLNAERTLGSYNFSIKGLFVFILILVCSLFISRIISFFASEPEYMNVTEKKSRRADFGSWILLMRIFVICLGLYLAFAAVGIPLDRLTIILGALGVGIGLGLQGIVHNLVSGLIIAFEKPVNVGDIIEIDNKLGTMKSIGFRSSVIIMPDGSNIVVPNGDLLSMRLVNWTMGKNLRRLNIAVGVAYGTDIEKVKKILLDIVENDNQVLKNPAPVVIVKDFGDSSIQFELLVWAPHIRYSLTLKSEIISKIDQAFREAGVVIPFPQQDVYIHNLQDKKSDDTNAT